MSAIPLSDIRPLGATVGKKVLLAVTGLVMYGFVFVHMVGNLQLYAGPEKINHYGELLQNAKPLLWTARIVLLAAVGIHILLSLQLWLKNRAARPVKYSHQDYQVATYASRTMILSGPIIGFFIVYHILHFTVGSVHPDFVKGDVFHNVVVGFQNPLVSGFYVLAMVCLGFHLYHGAYSLFQTLGLRGPTVEKKMKVVLTAISMLIVIANISFPLSVLAGIVKLPAVSAPASASLAAGK